MKERYLEEGRTWSRKKIVFSCIHKPSTIGPIYRPKTLAIWASPTLKNINHVILNQWAKNTTGKYQQESINRVINVKHH